MTAQLTSQNFNQEVLKSSLPVLVDFWAQWCGPCRMLAPVVEGLGNRFSGKLKVGKLDTDAHSDIAAQYNISSIPCCILFKNGQEATRFVGFRPEDQFAADLQAYL